MRSPKPSATNNKKILGIVFLTILIDLIGFSIIFPLFPALLEYYLPQNNSNSALLYSLVSWFHQFATNSHVNPHLLSAVLFGGIIGSLYSILQFITTPIWGRLSDSYGRKPILLITILGNTVSYAWWALSGNFWSFLVSRIIMGVMGGNISVANAAVADVTSRKDRGKGMAIVGVAFGLGFIMGPAIGGIFSQVDLIGDNSSRALIFNPFSAPALAGCLLSLINFCWVASRFEETLPAKKRNPLSPGQTKGRISQILSVDAPSIRKTYWVNFLFTTVLSGMEFTLTFVAVERFFYTPYQNGMLFVYIGLIMLITQGYIIRKHCFPKLGEKKTLILGFITGVPAYACIAYSFSTSTLYIGLGLLALSTALITPSLSALVSLYASSRTQGRYMGSFRATGALARTAGPIMGALLYFTLSSQLSYSIGAAILILPLLVSLKLPTPSKEEEDAPEADSNYSEPALANK